MMVRSLHQIYSIPHPGYKTVDPNAYIARLKRLRAMGPGHSGTEKDGHGPKHDLLAGMKIFLKTR